MHGEVALARGHQRLDVQVDLADLVRRTCRRRRPRAVRVRVRERTVRLRGSDAPRVLVALVDGDHEERVALVDAVRLQPGEVRREGVVVRLELRLVVRLTRARRAREARVERRRERRRVVVVGVRDVPPRHGDARLLHLSQVAERVLRERAVESREAGLAEGIRHRLTFGVVDGRLAHDGLARRAGDGADRRVHVLRAVQRLEAAVSIRLVKELVRPCVRDVGRVRRADPAAARTVDRDPDEVGQRLRAAGGP